MKLQFSIFVVLTVALCLGCGSGQVQMKGTVTFSDDGSPLEVGTIAFTDGKMQARGDLGPGGEFTLGTAKVNDGLPPGKYNVYISGAISREVASEKGSGDSAVVVYSETLLIDPKYESAKTSGLSYQIDASTKSLDIKVDRATGKAAQPQLK
jgi:hypothetical protein